jgi:hypothetical protein
MQAGVFGRDLKDKEGNLKNQIRLKYKTDLDKSVLV